MGVIWEIDQEFEAGSFPMDVDAALRTRTYSRRIDENAINREYVLCVATQEVCGSLPDNLRVAFTSLPVPVDFKRQNGPGCLNSVIDGRQSGSLRTTGPLELSGNLLSVDYPIRLV